MVRVISRVRIRVRVRVRVEVRVSVRVSSGDLEDLGKVMKAYEVGTSMFTVTTTINGFGLGL